MEDNDLIFYNVQGNLEGEGTTKEGETEDGEIEPIDGSFLDVTGGGLCARSSKVCLQYL